MISLHSWTIGLGQRHTHVNTILQTQTETVTQKRGHNLVDLWVTGDTHKGHIKANVSTIYDDTGSSLLSACRQNVEYTM